MKTLFSKTTLSNIVKANGPSQEDQVKALANGTYWTVLNSALLRSAAYDQALIIRVNALKNALQTYGPVSEKLPDFRHNKGSAKGVVFHGHAHDSLGKTHVLEWTVIDEKMKLIALVNFASHENYAFRQKPLSSEEKKAILDCQESQKIMKLVAEKKKEAKEKVERVHFNYRLC